MHTLIQEKLKQLQEWLKKTVRKEYHSEVEHFLAQSTDAADLEHRIRLLRDRGYAI